MINLCRPSYMQAGVQIHGSVYGLRQRWDQLWRKHDVKHDVEADNNIVLGLKPVLLPPNNKCTLNHYPKALAEKA